LGLLERISAARVEQRYSADTYYSDYIQPFMYGGNQYTVGGHGLVQTLAGNRASEIVSSLPGYAAALRACPPAWAAEMVRALVLSQARFTFRNLPSSSKARSTFGTRELGVLERPWPRATTGELIARMEWHAGLAGNAFVYRQPNRLRVLRPDWVAILYGSHQEPEDAAHALDGQLIGYVYQNGGLYSSSYGIQTLLPADVAHWSPIPDPEAAGVGQSWITPAIKDMQGDRMASEHKVRFFENGATPNLVIKGIPAATKTQFDELVAMMEEKHSGIANAYRTLYLTAGADAAVVGSNLAELDMKSVNGASETRIAFLSRVHPVILGIAEGLAGSSLNAGNFGMARRIWADTWIYPTLQDLSACLGTIIKVPSDAELWFDVGDMPILREDAKDAADIEHVKMQGITQYVREGFTAESAVAAVHAQDVRLLKHTGRLSVQLQRPGEVVPPAAPVTKEPAPMKGGTGG
jgi:phage portal protein BeeE